VGNGPWRQKPARPASRSPSPPASSGEADGVGVGTGALLNTGKVLIKTMCFPHTPLEAGLPLKSLNRLLGDVAILRAKGVGEARLVRTYYDYFLKVYGGPHLLRSLVFKLAGIPYAQIDANSVGEWKRMLAYFCERLEEHELQNGTCHNRLSSYDVGAVIKTARIEREGCHDLIELQLSELMREFAVDPFQKRQDCELTVTRLQKALEQLAFTNEFAARNCSALSVLMRGHFGAMNRSYGYQRHACRLEADRETLKRIVYALLRGLCDDVELVPFKLLSRDKSLGRPLWVRYIASAGTISSCKGMSAISCPSTIRLLVCALADGCTISTPARACAREKK